MNKLFTELNSNYQKLKEEKEILNEEEKKESLNRSMIEDPRYSEISSHTQELCESNQNSNLLILEKHKLLKSFCTLICDYYKKLKKLHSAISKNQGITHLKRQSSLEVSKENYLLLQIEKINDWSKKESKCNCLF